MLHAFTLGMRDGAKSSRDKKCGLPAITFGFACQGEDVFVLLSTLRAWYDRVAVLGSVALFTSLSAAGRVQICTVFMFCLQTAETPSNAHGGFLMFTENKEPISDVQVP